MVFLWKYMSPLGQITMAGREDVLVGLWFEGQKHFASTLGPDAAEGWLPVFGETCRWLDIYFSGSEPGFVPRIDLCGTPFREAVWKELLAVPYGETISYGELGRRITWTKEHPISPRAVGGAVGHNPISLIVPCHRVIGSDGRLTGYAGGLDLKASLLKLEKESFRFL